MAAIVRGPGPLDGIKVLDFTRVYSGPHCTRMLVDFGAEVIKVEPPDGDLTRISNPKVASLATYYTQQNCGKPNLSLDLRKPEAVELMLRLVDQVDIVVENYRPDVMDRLGLGWEVIHARNPRVIFASINGYGSTGVWAMRRAYAPVISAEMGMTVAQSEAFRAPLTADTFSHPDVYTGLECLSGILAALYQRERTGRGQRVEVSMAETTLSINEHVHWYLRRDLEGASEHDIVPSFSNHDYPIVKVAGQHVLISAHAGIASPFQTFMDMMNRPDLADDPRLATVDLRKENLDLVYGPLQEWANTFATAEELMDVVDRHGLATGIVRSTAEAAMTPWAIERGALVEVDNRQGGTIRIPNSPVRFSDADAGIRGLPRYRGEDNRTVLAEKLGLTDAELDDLEARNVLLSRLPKAR